MKWIVSPGPICWEPNVALKQLHILKKKNHIECASYDLYTKFTHRVFNHCLLVTHINIVLSGLQHPSSSMKTSTQDLHYLTPVTRGKEMCLQKPLIIKLLRRMF